MSTFGKLVITLILALCPSVLYAATGPWQQDDSMAVRLISSLKGTGEKTEILLGLDIRLASGWHTYWRSPGDAGLPPTLNWTGSENLKQAELLFPAPERIDENGLKTLGYHGTILLPLRASVQETGKPLNLKLKLDLLLCHEICVPKNFDLTLDVPAGPAELSNEIGRIEAALGRIPKQGEAAGLTFTNITVAREHLSLTAYSQTKLRAPELILETPGGGAIAPSSTTLGIDSQTVTFRTKLDNDLIEKAASEGLPLTATLIDGKHAVESHIIATDSTPTMIKLLGFMLLALIGGFILNLMPCVLPVLSLKILGLIRHGGKSSDEIHLVRHSFLATAGGVIFSFFVLALVTLLLKASGLAFGWGVQFQQPVFLVFLISILTFFSCNLLGFFEITLPRCLMDSVDPIHHPKLAGDFATGALATLLATPCTAPFLGTAIAFALAAGSVEIITIFLALGVGMALPYLLIALRPSLATRLPKPGAWMLKLTRFLGLGLAATALWLLYVLNAEIGRQASFVVAGTMLVLAFLLHHRHNRGDRKWILPVAILLLIRAMITAHITSTPTAARQNDRGWTPYNAAELEDYLREGKTVYVDVTADWCLTCKVNKRLTLGKPEIAKLLFSTENLIAMRADWTNPDPRIIALLRKHNRFGIPFTVVYGPGAPKGIVLPELLFPEDVIDAVGRALGPKTNCPANLPAGSAC